MQEPTTTPQPAPAADSKTRTFKAPSGTEVEVKKFLNVREFNTLKKTLYGGVQMQGSGTEDSVEQHASGAVLVEVEEKLVELAVIRYGDKHGTDALEAIMGAEDSADYTAIVKELEPLTTNLFTRPSR